MVRHPSVIVHTFKLEYLWSQLANLDQILCVASLGWGKDCIRFWGRLDQISGFHGNRNPHWLTIWKTKSPPFLVFFFFFFFFFYLILFILAGNEDMHNITDKFEFLPDRTTDYGVIRPWAFPLTLNGENGVSIFSQLLWIQTSLNLQEMRTGIKSWTGSNFGRIWPVILELPALQPWKNDVSTFSQSPLIGSLSNLQVMRTGIKARTSSNLGQIGLFTLELFALEHRFLIPGAVYMY